MSPASGAPRKRWVVPVVLLLVVLVAIPVGHWLHRRTRHGLFAGPYEEGKERRSGFYPGVVYDLSAYVPPEEMPAESEETGTPDLLSEDEDPRKKDQAGEAAYQAHKLEFSTGATKVARLRSQTVYKESWAPRFLTLTYPCENAVFPPNLCAPSVEWSDVNNDLWQVTLSVPDASLAWTFLSAKARWRIPDEVWEQVKRHAVGRRASLWVKGIRQKGLWGKARPSVHRSQVVNFRVSEDPADNAVVYRLISPPAVNDKTPDMFVRDIRERRQRLLLGARQLYCLNCHCFSSKTGTKGQLGLQVRYKGDDPQPHRMYLALYDMEKQSGRKMILPFAIQMTTFMGWSPDETKLAISANQRIGGYRPVVLETQASGQPTSDIAVYDTTDGTVLLLPGASGPTTLEIFPAWTPDGKSIVFSSAPAGRHPTQTQYEIFVVPYNDGRGGKPQPVRGASRNGKSNYLSRFSPDGKWFTFTRSDWGLLIKASSDIYIMPADLKTDPRPLECNTPYAADSWHSWSSNSRWIVFATKRDDGILARLYLTHIDRDGHASPAVRLPLEDPDMTECFNIPEFLATMPSLEERRLFDGVGIGADVFKVQTRSTETQ